LEFLNIAQVFVKAPMYIEKHKWTIKRAKKEGMICPYNKGQRQFLALEK